MSLKRCPFCGADQNVEHDYADFVFSPNLVVMSKNCWKCGATAGGVFVDDYDTEEEAEQAAIDNWNTRADDSKEDEE